MALLDDSARQRLKEALDSAPNLLSDGERMVLTMRFGLEDGQERTMEEASQHFGVSRVRIWQIEKSALRKLLRPRSSI